MHDHIRKELNMNEASEHMEIFHIGLKLILTIRFRFQDHAFNINFRNTFNVY
jgi:hypothetical protein